MKAIKTIDINVKEWFDKASGNSYFAGDVTVDFGTKDARTYNIPFQYGYGEAYIHAAKELLKEKRELNYEIQANGSSPALWQICHEGGIILRTSKQGNCKKRELKQYSN